MILYITRKYPPSVGGMQRFNFKLLSNLENITPIASIKWGGSQNYLPLFLIYAFLKALWICLTKPISCIYLSDGLLSPFGYILKLITRKPVVANIHGRDIAFDFKPYQVIIPWALRRMDKVICVSKELMNECIKRKVPEKILHVIPNGVDIEDFVVPDNLKGDFTVNGYHSKDWKGKYILLTIGRLVPKKGVDSFLKNIYPKIIKEKSNVLYLIVGGGPLLNNVKEIIQQNNLSKHVIVLGQVSMDSGNLAKVYQRSDIFVMPNVRVKDDMEGFGIVAIEGGAAGLPVVASNVDGIAEAIVDQENGFLIKDKQYDDFANQVLELLSNDEIRKEFGNKAKEYVQTHYSWKTIAQNYLKQFTDELHK